MRTFFSALLLFPIMLQAQTWAPIGATWTYKQGVWSGPDTNLAVIENVGDTTISGLLYSTLEATAGSFVCFPLYRYIHFDGDSLWFLDDVASDPQLLWCMNATPGQTWQTRLRWGGIPMDTITWTVLDTTHIVEDGVWLRQLTLDYASATMAMSPYCWPACTVTDRLGNWKYFFDFQYGSCDAETHHGLRCYEDSVISWLNPMAPQCDLMTGLGETPPNTISISPTLVACGEPILIKDSGGSSNTVETFDVHGRLVHADRWIGTLIFALNDPGCYLVRITDDQGYAQQARIAVY